ncbi:S8 family serine peptidase [Methanocalculus taiwanensis]|uniref:S8 family serine peptidase n=1 Tax=Methanocalculus taiwanensis TaxID=106207 RepID=A0ABD4TGW6_9EURY|nr:S8 family serine peptidase [Methanocalculus taiwanensis]MCQ1537746.1 S8 family serine peptidase [Methanocalculus taiwanensis]
MDTRFLILSLALILLLTAGTVAAAPFAGEPQHVIIVMKDRPADDADYLELNAFAEASQRDIISSVNRMSVDEPRSLWSVNAIAATLTEEQVKQVAARPDVARVVPDRIVTLDLTKDTGLAENGDRRMRFFRPATDNEIEWIDPAYPYEEDIAWGVSWIEAPEVWANGFDGTGVTVAVIDTGIKADHPDLAGKIVGWADLVNSRTDPYDDHGHGTHCAGTVAGMGAGGIYTGVAPGADLIGVKVFNSGGSGNTSTVLAGFEKAVELGADVISYSGGAIGFDSDWDEIVLDSSEGIDIPINVSNFNDGFDPTFILLWLESRNNEELEITMRQPNGSVYQGVDCDWYDTPCPPEWGMLKYIGNAALAPGEWTLTIQNPSLNTSEKIWHSGTGYDLNNILYQRFNLTDHMEGLESLTFNISTRYAMETSYDYGYVEVLDTQSQQWFPLLVLNGRGSGVYSVNLTPFVLGQAPPPGPMPPIGPYSVEQTTGPTYLDLRLRYETDSSIIWDGWFIDWMAIPEIGFYDDASGDAGWTADPAEGGWSRISDSDEIYYEWLICYADNGTSLTSQSANRIVENGTVFVTSAGNKGEYGLRSIGAPAAAEKVIAVGATGQSQDYIAFSSSRGPAGWGNNLRIKPDVTAPGQYILSTSVNGGYTYMSGTSMACPHVSGIAALLLQANSTLSPNDVKTIITETAVDLGPEGPDYDYGYGRVSAWAAIEEVTPLVPPTYDAPMLHAGFGFGNLKMGEPNVITAISWNGTPLDGENIHFRIWSGQQEFLNTTNVTNAHGMATASFVPNASGSYSYDVRDAYGNSVSGSIMTRTTASPRELFLFDTVNKDYYTVPNETVPIKYTLVDPQTLDPYAGDVRMVISASIFGQEQPVWVEYLNETITPVNGTIEKAFNVSGMETNRAEIVLAPVANLTQARFYGDINVNTNDFVNQEVKPSVTIAEKKGNATLLVKQYTFLDAQPVPDGIFQLPVVWLYEVDVKALSLQFPDQTAELLSGMIQKLTPEYADLFAEIQNMQENTRLIPYETKNGIGKVTVPVPDGAYLGVVLSHWYDDDDHNGPYSELSEYQALIIVDPWPFEFHPSAPLVEPNRDLFISGDWKGAFAEDARSIAPGTEMNLTCYLQNKAGEPVAGTVYLYTSDSSAIVTTGSDGYGHATLPAVIRFEDAWGYNQLQVVGLSGDAYSYTYVSPPYEWVTITGEFTDSGNSGVLRAGTAVYTPDGEPIPMPGIFEVSRTGVVESYMGSQWWGASASLLSSYLTGTGFFAETVPYGAYETTVAVKDWFWRGGYSQGNWWVYSTYLGATPLTIANPPPEFAEHAGWINVNVQMADGASGVPIYLVYDTVGPDRYMTGFFGDLASSSTMSTSESIYTDMFGAADIQTTGPDGSATLKMYVPENSQVWWEIGGGTPDRVFTTQSGYTIQDTPPEPVAPVANFIGVPATGPAPLTVRFTDTSTGVPTSWTWNFGDGTNSTERHPTKIYQNHGVYTVSLTATNEQGQNTTTKAGYITVLQPTTIMAGNSVIPTGMNRTTGVSVSNMQNMTAVGLNLTFDQTLVQLTAVRPNASVENKVEGFVTEIDNTTGKLNLSMTLQPGIDQGAEPMQIIDLVFAAEQKIGSCPITYTRSEFSGGVSGDVQPFVIVDDGSLRVRMRGDFNDNGRIDIGDVARVAYMAAGLITVDLEADFNGDGVVDAADAAKIAYVYVGKYHEL